MSKRPRTDKYQSWQGALAYRLWVQEQMKALQVCHACGINEVTLRKWRARNGWDLERERHPMGYMREVNAVRGALARLTEELSGLAAAPKPGAGKKDERLARTAELGRAIQQLAGTLEHLRKAEAESAPPYRALKLSEDLMDFAKRHEPAALDVIRPLLRRYVRERIFGRTGQS